MTQGSFEWQFFVTQGSDCDAGLVRMAVFCDAGLGLRRRARLSGSRAQIVTQASFEWQFSVTQGSDCDARLVRVAIFCDAGIEL